MAEDRVLSGTQNSRLYRVVAGDAFSWSALLIEDQLGERFVLDTVTRSLTPVSDTLAAELIETRAYRPWNGPQRWSSVADISPVIGEPARQLEMPADFDGSDLDSATN
jgi:hypothetical protein